MKQIPKLVLGVLIAGLALTACCQPSGLRGGFTSAVDAENAQAARLSQQQALQHFPERIDNEMANATEQYQKVLRDSLNSYLRDYNKDQRYKLILSKSGDNVLYAAPTADITADVIAGLNKRYKK